MTDHDEAGANVGDELEQRGLVRILHSGAAGGITLTLGLVAGVTWASLDPSGYATAVATPVHLPLVPSSEVDSIGSLITNLAMIVFFFAIGLEVARERTLGVLADNRTAALPVIAAIGGMAGAALIYLGVIAALGPQSAAGGWGIPMATDIAFTLGALSLLGSNVPSSVRVFLLALAVADDVLSVIILAIVGHEHTGSSSLALVLAATGVIVVCVGLIVARRRRASWPTFIAAGLILWWCLASLGIEPTLAGVIAGIAAPFSHQVSSPGVTLERWMVPASSYIVLPAFALVAGGVDLVSFHLGSTSGLFTAVLGARVLGKLIGITGAVALAIRLGLGTLPDRSKWRHMGGAAVLCGIGFTVPLLFAHSAFGTDPTLLATTKVALLVASLLCGILGLAILVMGSSRRSEHG